MSKSTATLTPIDPLAGGSWDEAVQQHSEHTIFHRSAWARVLSEAYGHRPFYLRSAAAWIPLAEVHSRITGCRGVSLPFADSAGPLWLDKEIAPATFRALIDFAAERGWKRLEIRDDRVIPETAEPAAVYESHDLELTAGERCLEENLSPSVRRALRKAGRSELKTTIETSATAVAEYYHLHEKTRRRNGLPPQPRRFFQAIADHLITRQLGFVVLARFHGSPVAGAVFLRSGGHAIYKFGASDTHSWPLRPNQQVMWTAIRHLAGTGCQRLNFGRTAAGDEGLCRFKLSWGCTRRPLRYFRHSAGQWQRAAGDTKESHPFLFSRLPLPLNRLAGEILYPHLD